MQPTRSNLKEDTDFWELITITLITAIVSSIFIAIVFVMQQVEINNKMAIINQSVKNLENNN